MSRKDLRTSAVLLLWMRVVLALLWPLSTAAHAASQANPAIPSEDISGQLVPDPAILFQQGVAALREGRLQIAQDDFRQVIVLDPQSSAAHINLGVAYMRVKRWDDALVELRRAQSLAPNEPGIPLNIGLVYYKKSDFDAAIEPLSATLRQNPNSQQARYLLGLCYFFRNRYQEAAATLTPLWQAESRNLNYLYVLSIAAGKSSNVPLEEQASGQMVAIGQNSPELHLFVGKAWLARGDTEKAAGEFRAAAMARPSMPLVHYFLGRVYLEQRAYPQAEAELTQELAREPDFPYAYEDLGQLYAHLQQTVKAEQAFRQALDRDSTLVNSYVGLGQLYRHSGRYREALEMLDQAVALVPASASIHYARAQVLVRLGQSASAQQEFATSAKLLKSFNDRLQDPTADQTADAQQAAQQ